MSKALALTYRPQKFDDVVEQDTIKIILRQQLETNTIKNAYLFTGAAGTGKTTCARIFANEINKGKGNPIEIDAASNNGVDNVREIIRQAQTQSLDSEYKIFIVDECHSISNAGWQAMLKLIEEPPAKSIFIFCTTDPQKIPKTILSRVQRYDFQRISQRGIHNRLVSILAAEGHGVDSVDYGAVEYIAKIADGGMRDAITLLDKCLAYSTDLTPENVIKALGTVDYTVMFNLLESIIEDRKENIIKSIESVHMEGRDLKQFIKQFTDFILDINKYRVTKSFEFISIPKIYESELNHSVNTNFKFLDLLDMMVRLNADIKWEVAPKAMIEATLFIGV